MGSSTILISEIAGFLKGKALDKAFGLVVGELSEWRQDRLFDVLGRQLEEAGQDPAKELEVEESIKRLFSGGGEALMDAYRRVTYSVSRDYGPTIIALILTDLVRADRRATPVEELWLKTAEVLTDCELKSLAEFLDENFSGASADLVFQFESDEDSPNGLSLGLTDLGSWAQKLLSIGALSLKLHLEFDKGGEVLWDFKEDAHETEPSLFVARSIVMHSQFVEIRTLVERAKSFVFDDIGEPSFGSGLPLRS